MDIKELLQAVFILTCISQIHSQYYDFFQAFQPFVQPQPSQPLNFLNDFTTRRPKPKQKVINDVKHEENTRKLDRIPITDNNNNNNDARKTEFKQPSRRKQSNVFDFNFFTTTQRPTRKTTKAPSVVKSQNRQDTHKSSPIIFIDDARRYNNSREDSREKPKRPGNRKVQQPVNYDTNYYDGRNTVNYYTTRQPTTKAYNYQNNKKVTNNNYYTTHNPLLNRPGVKPAVVNGPPITNRPVTQRPHFDHKQVINIDDDLNVSPEVISGPDEDYMSAVDKKRYIDIAERMCDKYKSLNTKQVEAIPLLPSPQPVRVNVSSCLPTTIPLVVGGKVVSVQEFPHMVLLGWKKAKTRGYSWKCGGSLVSNQFILTAAHCAYQDRDDNVIPGPPRIVQLGSSFLNDPKAVFMKVASVTRHPKYKLPKAYYDLAIVKMANTVTFSDMIKPACLGTPPPPNSPIIATGWGRTEFGGSQSHELRSVSLPVWDISDCHNALGVSVKIPFGPSSDSQICAGEKRGGKDTCQGDSGGPAQVQDGCMWRVVAVTSVGRYCGAADTPAIYAIVQRPFVSAVIFGKEATQNNDNRNNNRETQTTINNQGSNWNKPNNRETSTTINNQGSNWNKPNNRETLTTINNQGSSNWNKPANEPTNTNQNNNWNGMNDWNRRPSTGAGSFSNNGETYNWNTYNQQGSFPTNSNNQRNKNEYNNNNNNYNYNSQTTENYNSNSRRDNDYYNPSASRETENSGQFYNNYAGSNNFNNNNNYNRQDYNSGSRGDSYYNNDGNVWWT